MERYLKSRLGSRSFEGVDTKRSKTMSKIRGKGNKTTELALRMAFVRAGFTGWTLHTTTLPGKPDFYFDRARLAVFVDGCFWHGCPKCGHTPKTRSEFWRAKFERNQFRDRRATRNLRSAGIRVIRIWEHELRSPQSVQAKIRLISSALIPGALRHSSRKKNHAADS